MKTIEVRGLVIDGVYQFDRREAQSIMKVPNRQLWRKYLIACGYNPDDLKRKYTWEDITLLCTLKQFLKAKSGRYGHTFLEFYELQKAGKIDQIIDQFNLKPNQLMEQKQNEYYNRTKSH